MPGKMLRTNYRTTGGVVDVTGIGGAYPLTSYAGGAGTQLPYGGLIGGSIATSGDSYVATSNVIEVSAFGAMSAWYGGGAYDAGYKIKPFAFNPRIWNPSVPAPGSGVGFPWATISGSIFCLFAGGSANSAAASCFSAVLEWWGFIVSAP